MVFLDFLKKRLPEQEQSNEAGEKDYSRYTAHFLHGHLVKITPPPKGSLYENRDIANNACQILSDGVKYDLTDIQSIRAIAIPKYSREPRGGIGTTGYLDYILRMRAGNYWNNKDYKLAISCLEKATCLMQYSTMGWPAKDFFRIVNWLNDLGCFAKAKKWENWIIENIPGAKSEISSSFDERNSYYAYDHFKRTIDSCRFLGTDLIETGEIGACCPICAMYRKRVFSLKGADRRFPKFPGDFHFGCGLSANPYKYGIMEPSFRCKDIVMYSNRPFVDDRTQKEKKDYAERMEKISKEPPVIREPSLNRIIFYRLVQLIPNDMPKSLNGFSRMRNSNSKNYQILVKKAESAGFVFPKTLKDVWEWPENR